MSQPYTLRANLAALPRPAWILFLGTFLNKFGSFVVPFLTLYLTGRGYSGFDAGLAVGSYGIGNLGALLLGGYLADHIGRRRTIVASMFSGGVALLLLSQARSLHALLALSALAGLTGEFYRPAGSALLADLVPPAQRVTAFSAYRLAFNAGWAFGPAIAGFLAGRSYLWLFVGNALASFGYGAVALIALPRDGRHAGHAPAGWLAAWTRLKRDRDLHRILIGTFLIGAVMLQMISTFSLQVARLGYPGATYGLIISMNGAMIVLFELPLTTLTARFAPRTAIAAGYLLMGAGTALFTLARSAVPLTACTALFTLGEMIAMPLSSAYVANLAPPNMRGRYMASYGLMWTLATVLAPGIGMQLFAIRPAALWLACGAAAVAAAVAVRRELAPAPAPAAADQWAGP